MQMTGLGARYLILSSRMLMRWALRFCLERDVVARAFVDGMGRSESRGLNDS